MIAHGGFLVGAFPVCCNDRRSGIPNLPPVRNASPTRRAYKAAESRLNDTKREIQHLDENDPIVRSSDDPEPPEEWRRMHRLKTERDKLWERSRRHAELMEKAGLKTEKLEPVEDQVSSSRRRAVPKDTIGDSVGEDDILRRAATEQQADNLARQACRPPRPERPETPRKPANPDTVQHASVAAPSEKPSESFITSTLRSVSPTRLLRHVSPSRLWRRDSQEEAHQAEGREEGQASPRRERPRDTSPSKRGSWLWPFD